jgi:hypothetical protein
LAPERIDPETLRRSTLPRPKPIPPGQPKWVYLSTMLDMLVLKKLSN